MLTDSASSGDRLRTLEDLRDVLAQRIEDCRSSRDLAALSARLQSVLSEIAELRAGARPATDPVDEINARRQARGAASARRTG